MLLEEVVPIRLNPGRVTSGDAVDNLTFIGHLSFQFSETTLQIVARTNLIFLAELNQIDKSVFSFNFLNFRSYNRTRFFDKSGNFTAIPG